MNYNNIHDTEMEKIDKDIHLVEDSQDVRIGIVTDCKRLNVREEPRVDATIVCEVAYQTELMIDEKESNDEFYKVFTASGIEGYCMKKFIAVQP